MKPSLRGAAGHALQAEISRQGRDLEQLAQVLGVTRKHLVRALSDRGHTRLLDLLAAELGVRLHVTATTIGAPR